MNYLTKPSEEDLQMIDPSKVYRSKVICPKSRREGRSNRSIGEQSRQSKVKRNRLAVWPRSIFPEAAIGRSVAHVAKQLVS
jgi:hypothetical protein